MPEADPIEGPSHTGANYGSITGPNIAPSPTGRTTGTRRGTSGIIGTNDTNDTPPLPGGGTGVQSSSAPSESSTAGPSSLRPDDGSTTGSSSRGPNGNSSTDVASATGPGSLNGPCEFCDNPNKHKNFKRCDTCGRQAHHTCAKIKKTPGINHPQLDLR